MFTKYPDEKMTADLLELALLSFIEENASFEPVAVDLVNELKLYGGEEKLKVSRIEADSGETGNAFLTTLKQTIAMYETLLLKQKTQGAETAHTEKLLLTLRAQLAGYGKVKSPRKEGDQLSASMSVRYSHGRKLAAGLKERRTKALDEIYHFYTKQCALAHVRKTFDAVQNEMNAMALGYLLKFIKDFAIPIELKVLKSVRKA